MTEGITGITHKDANPTIHGDLVCVSLCIITSFTINVSCPIDACTSCNLPTANRRPECNDEGDRLVVETIP
jgi:hypothetical protein